MKNTKTNRRIWIGVIALAVVGIAFAIWKSGRSERLAIAEVREGTGETHDPEKTQYWISGMHPWIIMPEPGQCPICGMDLVPLDPSKFAGEIAIDPVVVQNMGVRVEEVTSGPLVKSIRTVGIVDYDEENVRDVNTKVSGWIEELYVDSLGAKVKKGDPLFSLYSPQLFSAQQDFLIAAKGGNQSLADAARTRLDYFDITPEQIEALRKRGEPQKALTVGSPYSGVVITKHANEGMKVEPGMQVYRIADLSKVWVMVTAYEYQLPYIQQGQDAVMTLEYIPGQTLEGKVAYIYPYLDKKTREVQVRLEVDNPNGLLKPGMFTSVELRNRLAAEATLAPRSAIIDTGKRKVAFVSLGEGKFEPREVETGVATENANIQILSGLQPGEKVVTSGQFLLDSEANMREALAKMMQGDSAAEQAPTIAKASANELTNLPPAGQAALRDALDAYLASQTALAADSTDGVSKAATTFEEALGRLQAVELPDDPHFWHTRSGTLKIMLAEAAKLTNSSDLAAARLAFGKLSVPFRALVAETGVPPGETKEVLALRCPMFLEDQGGAVWLQAAGDVRNPYMGDAMLACFDERTTLPSAGNSTEDAGKP